VRVAVRQSRQHHQHHSSTEEEVSCRESCRESCSNPHENSQKSKKSQKRKRSSCNDGSDTTAEVARVASPVNKVSSALSCTNALSMWQQLSGVSGRQSKETQVGGGNSSFQVTSAGLFDMLPLEMMSICFQYLGVRDLSFMRGTCLNLWRQVCHHTYYFRITALCMCRNLTSDTSTDGTHKKRKNSIRDLGTQGVAKQVAMRTTMEYRNSGMPLLKWPHMHNEACQVEFYLY
jgi:hypothetical protein